MKGEKRLWSEDLGQESEVRSQKSKKSSLGKIFLTFDF